MKRFRSRVSQFFFPSAEAPFHIKIFPYALLVIAFLAILVGGAYTWDYTNSPEFCGTACHTMPPSYTTYQNSAHAQILCVECHIGREFIGSQMTRKISDVRHVIAAITQDYEYPLQVKTLRPAREICERCHHPEKFSANMQKEFVSYLSDKMNSKYRTYMIFNTGGGTAAKGQGKGIHWHIENEVYYYASDENDQVIPYVKVLGNEDDMASVDKEFVDITSGIDPYDIDDSELKQMDCITCHNRAAHFIKGPEQAVDEALDLGLIPVEIPEIRGKAVEALSGPYDDNRQAINAITKLPNYYQEKYPAEYEDFSFGLNNAVEVLKEIYNESVFPEHKFDWDTHPSNMGHRDDPGCFRCHDGRHMESDGSAISMECNTCHSIPVVSGPTELVTQLEINESKQPNSHTRSNWIPLHYVAFSEDDENETCSGCHDLTDFDQATDVSFCSNEVCHSTVWDALDFEIFTDPDLKNQMILQLGHYPRHLPPHAYSEEPSLEYIHEVEEEILCEDCHTDFPDKPIDGPAPNDTCIECHGETYEGTQELTAYLDPNPHDGHEGAQSCALCHPNFGPPINPCALCHADEPMEQIAEPPPKE